MRTRPKSLTKGNEWHACCLGVKSDEWEPHHAQSMPRGTKPAHQRRMHNGGVRRITPVVEERPRTSRQRYENDATPNECLARLHRRD